MIQNFHLAQAIRAASHKLRREMLLFIEEKQSVTVTEIFIHCRLDQAVASAHLAILRRAGLVTTQRDGKNIFYFVNGTALYLLQVMDNAWAVREGNMEQLIFEIEGVTSQKKRLKKAA